MSIESVMPYNHVILCHLFLLPSIFPSIKVFSSESAVHLRWPKYWSFSFSISPSNEYLGWISFRIDWFDLLAVQGLSRVFSNTRVWKDQFFRAQLSLLSNSLWPHGLQHARDPCPSPSPGVCSNPCPMSQWCHPTITSSVYPSPLALSLSQHQGLFQWVSSSYQVAKILELQL